MRQGAGYCPRSAAGGNRYTGWPSRHSQQQNSNIFNDFPGVTAAASIP
jgi:hypothetical protein